MTDLETFLVMIQKAGLKPKPADAKYSGLNHDEYEVMRFEIPANAGCRVRLGSGELWEEYVLAYFDFDEAGNMKNYSLLDLSR